MIRRLRELLPRAFARAVPVVGLAAYASGTLSALLAGAPELFQRFGAIGVAAAILFFDDRLARVELLRQQSMERLLHEYGLELEALKEGIAPTSMPERGYLIDYLQEEARLERLRRQAAWIGTANILLLVVATLQWGFGDIFLEWVHA